MASFDFEMASFDFEMAPFDFARLRLATLRTNGCRDHGSVLRSWETRVNWMVSFDFASFDHGSVLRSWETLVNWMASFDFARPSTGSGLASLSKGSGRTVAGTTAPF